MPYNDIEIGADGLARCGWVGTDQLYQSYHDDEWGTPLTGDQPLFERISLEAFQAGLSWITILRRRENFRKAFHNFAFDEVANFTTLDAEELMRNEGIIRNRLKIEATISNARIVSDLPTGYLSALIWSFKPEVRQPTFHSLSEVPTQTRESEQMSKTLKKLGFRFVGPTTMYALMTSVGMVNGHIHGCHKREVASLPGP